MRGLADKIEADLLDRVRGSSLLRPGETQLAALMASTERRGQPGAGSAQATSASRFPRRLVLVLTDRRLLVFRAAQLASEGKPYTTEAAMAKLFASEAACRAAASGVQIHGGYGFTREFLVERIYRDVKLCTIGEGTSEIQRLVIAREILKA